jgi:hypothetical protein
MLTQTIRLTRPATDEMLECLVGTERRAKFYNCDYPRDIEMAVTVVAAERVPENPRAARLGPTRPWVHTF